MADKNYNIKITADTKGAIKSIKKLDDTAEDTSSSVLSIATSFNPVALAAKAAAVAFTALSATAAVSVRNFAKFENELLGVKTLLSETSFGSKSLSDGFSQMQADITKLARTAPVDISSLNKSLFDTVSAGIAAGDAVKVLGTSAKLAVAGLTDVSVATDGMTSAINAYGFEAEEADSVASKFFAAQKQGKTTIAELANGFGIVGSSAAAMGVEFNDLLSAVSAVTLAGVKTSAAYSGMKAVLSNIAKPTAEAAIEAKRLGIEFNTAGLRSKGLNGFLKELATNNKFTKDSVTKLFGSVEAQGMAFALTANSAEKYSGILNDLSNDSKTAAEFTDAHKVQVESLENQLKIMGNTIKIASIELGEQLMPVMKDFVKVVIESGPEIIAVAKAVGMMAVAFVKITKRLATSTTPELEALRKEMNRLPDTIQQANDQLDVLKKSLDLPIVKMTGGREVLKRIDEIKTRRDELDAEEFDILKLPVDKDTLIGDIDEVFGVALTAREEFVTTMDAYDEEQAAKAEEKKLLELERLRLLEEERKKIRDEARKKKDKDDKDDDKKEKKLAADKLKWKNLTAQQEISLVSNTGNLINAIAGKQTKAGFLLSKVAAAAQVLVADGQARAMAVTAAAGAAAASANPGVFALTASQMQGVITANTALSLGTIAASTIQGLNEGGMVDNIPAMLTRGEVVVPAQTSFQDLVDAGRSFTEDEDGGGMDINVTVGFTDNAFEIIEQGIIERRAIGVSAL